MWESLCRFDDRRHGAFAAWNKRVGAECMDLIALEFGAFFSGCVDYNTPLTVDLLRQLITRLAWMPEEMLEHCDDIVVTMVVIIEQHDVVRRKPLGLVFFLLFGGGKRSCVGVTHWFNALLVFENAGR